MGAPVDGIISIGGYGDLSANWYLEPSEFFVEYKSVDYVKEKISAGATFSTTEERIDLYVYLRQYGLWPRYVLGESFEAVSQEFSPIRHLTPNFPKTVLLHGAADMDVPANASRNMARAFETANIPHKLFILDGLGHDLFAEFDSLAVAAAWSQGMEFLKG